MRTPTPGRPIASARPRKSSRCWCSGTRVRARAPSTPRAAPGPAAAAQETLPNAPPAPRPIAQRVIAWHPIGGASADESRRGVGFGVTERGWADYVTTRVLPQLDAGVRRILLHNPFGIPAGDEPMSFDQHVEAQEEGLRGLTFGFAEAWRPVVEGRFTDGEPVEVICYLGSLDTDADFRAILQDDSVGRAADWLQRVTASLDPALRAGMSIGFDSSSDLPEDSPEFRLIQLVRALGHRCYVEPRPLANRPRLHDFAVISTQQHWFRSDPARHQGTDHNATNEQLTGEIVVLVNRMPDDDARSARARRYLAEHPAYSVAVQLHDELGLDRSLLQWAAGRVEATNP